MSRVSVLGSVCVLVALSSGAARAQAPSTDSLPPAPPTFAGGVVTTPLRVDQSFAGSARLGVSPLPESDATVVREALVAVRPAGLRHRGPGVALMIVGAAGVITGLLIDESLITVVGAGVGLVGLYLYVR